MGWIDFNKDGDFLDAGEGASVNVAPGQTTANLSWSGFIAPTAGTSYARFRITSDTNITANPTPLGLANNGEVEDYRVIIAALDYGDAPDPGGGTGVGNYKTTASDGGPSHVIVNGLSLGTNIDSEAGTLQNADANADDINGTPDDEDGVSSFPILTTASGQTYTVPINVTKTIAGNAYLVGYIDFNKDGDFEDMGEKSSTVTVSASGTQNVSFTTPSDITTGNTYARFRLSSTQAEAESSVGTATSGEVEDYQVSITTNAKVLLVKRITEINGDRTQNPNATSYKLNQVLDRPSFAADDAFPANNWPNSFLVGAYDAGPIMPSDTVEYTVYFMNSSGANADSVRICDRIVGAQQFLPDAYGAGRDIEYQLGTNPVRYLTKESLASIDRAELNTSTGTIAGCPAPSITGDNNGTIVVDITGSGSSGQETLTTLPGATAQGTPTNSYGYFRFKTRVNP
jgi:hypothetical protein